MLDYDYIKNHQRLIAVDITCRSEINSANRNSWKKCRWLNVNYVNVNVDYKAIDDDGTQSMLILLIWSLEILTILSKMANHQEAIAELTIT